MDLFGSSPNGFYGFWMGMMNARKDCSEQHRLEDLNFSMSSFQAGLMGWGTLPNNWVGYRISNWKTLGLPKRMQESLSLTISPEMTKVLKMRNPNPSHPNLP